MLTALVPSFPIISDYVSFEANMSKGYNLGRLLSVNPQEISFYRLEKIEEKEVDYYKNMGYNIGYRASSYESNSSFNLNQSVYFSFGLH